MSSQKAKVPEEDESAVDNTQIAPTSTALVVAGPIHPQPLPLPLPQRQPRPQSLLLPQPGQCQKAKASQTAATTTVAASKKRLQKVNWIPSPEKETYRTVLVNYHFNKKSIGRRSAGPMKKTYGNWNRMLNNIHKGHFEEDDVPDLTELFKLSREGSAAHFGAKKAIDMGKDEDKKPIENIKVEVYAIPATQKAEVENISKFERAETTNIIVISEDDDDDADADADADMDVDADADAGAHDADDKNKNIKKCPIETFVPMEQQAAQEAPVNSEKECLPTTSTKMMSKFKIRDSLENMKEKPSSSTTCHKVKVNLPQSTPPQHSTFKQRQLELHQYRVSVEQKRLELLNLKLEREREEMIREKVLFEKELQLKSYYKFLNEDNI